MARSIGKISVIGGGIMGGGIAALCARQGLQVIVKEATEELCAKAQTSIFERFDKWRKGGKITDEQLAALKGAVSFTANPMDLTLFKPDLVIEAIVEKLEIKHTLFSQLDNILPDWTIFASNTSTLPITTLASVTDRADKFVGMHFFNPPTTMKLVEVIPGALTDEETVQAVTDFTRNVLGKVPIRVKDRPGFLVNCLLLPYLVEAGALLQNGDVRIEDIDKAATDMGWPMGPYKLLDTVGIDTAYYAGKVLAQARPEIAPPELFELMVKENRLGDKTGSGFYKTAPGQVPLSDLLRDRFPGRVKMQAGTEAVLYRDLILPGLLREAVSAFKDGVATKEDIELGAVLGLGCPKGGPLHIVDELGLEEHKFFESW